MDSIGPISGIPPEVGATRLEAPAAAGSSSFAQELSGALGAADSLQLSADAQVDAVAQGHGNLHEASISLEKADISMRMMMNVRNKILSAYQDIMKMTI